MFLDNYYFELSVISEKAIEQAVRNNKYSYGERCKWNETFSKGTKLETFNNMTKKVWEKKIIECLSFLVIIKQVVPYSSQQVD